jgi:DNA processing protein
LMASEKSAYVFLSLLQAKVGSSLVSRLGGIPPVEVLRMTSADLAERMKMTERTARAFDELRGDFDLEVLEQRLMKRKIAILTPADGGYPELLKAIPDPPPALFACGTLPQGISVALVGSRKASATGIETARALGRALGERGVCVVSGLALGIDAAAHEGALEAGGPTVGVLGCGIDIVYPASNRALFERVRGNGALVSEYCLGEPPLAWRFPARNRVISGLCEATVVVEAPERSGALITANHALEAGRDVWAVPGTLGAPQCRGSNKLIADGAELLWDVDEFLEAVGTEATDPAEREPVAAVPTELPETEASALGGVGFEPTAVDVVAARSGVEMHKLLPALALLELKGYVRRDPGGAFLRRSGAP